MSTLSELLRRLQQPASEIEVAFPPETLIATAETTQVDVARKVTQALVAGDSQSAGALQRMLIVLSKYNDSDGEDDDASADDDDSDADDDYASKDDKDSVGSNASAANQFLDGEAAESDMDESAGGDKASTSD